MGVTMQFTGDMLSEMQQNEACKTPSGYDYRPVFARVKPLLRDCDYLVGNLETPVAGRALGYTDRLYCFNTPEAFLDAIADAGFDLVSTANNHCMDRGLEGLCRTLDALDARGIAHVGTHRGEAERAPFVRELNGMRFGFVSYTYGTNAFFHHLYLPEGAGYAVNLLQPEEEREGAIDLLAADDVPARVRALYDCDSPVFRNRILPLWNRLADDIKALRAADAEYVILLLHCGGQHNLLPDAYTRRVVRLARELGVNLVICNHQHILHPYEKQGDFRVAWCLGNLTATPDANPNGRGIGEENSALLQLRFERVRGKIQVRRARFAMLRCALDENGVSVSWPLCDLIAAAREETERGRYLSDLRHFVPLVRGGLGAAGTEPAAWYDLET